MSDSAIPPVVSLRRHEWRIANEPLARGGFGSVHLATADGHPPAVAKFIPKDPGAEREMLLGDDLSGVPNVVPRLDDGEAGSYWVIVMPRAEKSLRVYLDEKGRVPIDDAVQVLIDIAQALVALQDRIVHRDIKPENILLWDGNWCLTDFGISRYAEATTEQDTRKYAMTPAYAAPEQWRGDRATILTDVYATGIVAYEMIIGRPPYTGPDYRSQHLQGNPDLIAGLPIPLQSLLKACLNIAPESRPRPRSLLNQLKKSQDENSGAMHQLHQASQIAVRRRAEEERKRSIERSDEELRNELRETANQSLSMIISMVQEKLDDIPEVRIRKHHDGIECSLSEAKLVIDRRIDRRARWMDYSTEFRDRAFEVIDCAIVGVAFPPDQYGYEGRSHSLWFCDAIERNVFRWYETAFMTHPFSRKMTPLDPFAMFPDNDALLALEPVGHTHEIAWPFTPIDQGDEIVFLERWVDWFAAAAQGALSRPSHMPERNTRTWRLGNRP